MVLTTHPHLAQRLNREYIYIYIYSASVPSWQVIGWNLLHWKYWHNLHVLCSHGLGFLEIQKIILGYLHRRKFRNYCANVWSGTKEVLPSCTFVFPHNYICTITIFSYHPLRRPTTVTLKPQLLNKVSCDHMWWQKKYCFDESADYDLDIMKVFKPNVLTWLDKWFDILTTVLLNIQVFSDVTLNCWVCRSWWLEGIASSWTTWPNRWRRYVPLKLGTTHSATNHHLADDLKLVK
jgi:hypothetical protein